MDEMLVVYVILNQKKKIVQSMSIILLINNIYFYSFRLHVKSARNESTPDWVNVYMNK